MFQKKLTFHDDDIQWYNQFLSRWRYSKWPMLGRVIQVFTITESLLVDKMKPLALFKNGGKVLFSLFGYPAFHVFHNKNKKIIH